MTRRGSPVEEVIAFIVQVVLELGLQLLGSIGLDFAASTRDEESETGCGPLFGFAVLGGIIGGLSLLFAPHAILPHPWMRIANLIVAPILAGALSALVASWVSPRRGWVPSHHFWRAFCFALGFGLVRFAYIHR